jgi:hypothetical protein
MSYNTREDASARCGFEADSLIPQVCLDDAMSMIHSYTNYRWLVTTITETYSGNGQDQWLQVRTPIISVSSFTIDSTIQTETTDFELRKIEGMIRVYSGLPWGHDNIIITYNYGWQSTDNFYTDTISLVKRIEATIALYLWKNPLMAKKLAIEGLDFGLHDNHIQVLLGSIPRNNVFYSFDPATYTDMGLIL